MHKILILGISGMLGNTMFRYLSQNKDLVVYGAMRNRKYKSFFDNRLHQNIIDDLDIENESYLQNLFLKLQPNFVINCIGIIKQLKISDDIDTSTKINILFPHYLSKVSAIYNYKLIHFSTDCVFSGSKGNYVEADISDALDIYGKTKFLGEVKDNNSLTLRVSIIGHEINSNKSLIDWFLSQKKTIRGYTKAIFSGFPTVYLSEIIEKIISEYYEINGIFHLSSDPISKYDLLKLVSKIYKKDINIIPDESLIIDRSLNSMFIKNKYNLSILGWSDMILKMYADYSSLKNVQK